MNSSFDLDVLEHWHCHLLGKMAQWHGCINVAGHVQVLLDGHAGNSCSC